MTRAARPPAVLVVLLGVVAYALAVTISPTCGPQNTPSLIQVDGLAYDNTTVILFGNSILSSSMVVQYSNNTFTFLTMSNLTAGTYIIQIIATKTIMHCSKECFTNCSDPNCVDSPKCNPSNSTVAPTPPPSNSTDAPTPPPSNSTDAPTPPPSNSTDAPTSPPDNSSSTSFSFKRSTPPNAVITCNDTCTDVCVPFIISNTTVYNGTFVVYDVPPVILSFYPPVAIRYSPVTIYGSNFLNCIRTTVRIQASTSVQYYAARINSSTAIIFPTDSKTLSGTIAVSLDGEHFDSLSFIPPVLSFTDDDSSSSTENPPGGDKPSLTWLYIVLGIVAAAAAAFLIYILYRYKVKDDYSRLGL